MSYKKLQIWALAREVMIEIHTMTMTLPKFEMYEKARKSDGPVNRQNLLLLRDMEEEGINRIG